MIWDKAAIEKLVELWNVGLTGGEIAAHFKITRNMVMGKIHRLKKDGFVFKAHDNSTVTLPPKPNVEKIYPNKIFFCETTLEFIDAHGCRYIINADPPFLYCGQPQREGSPYCDDHHAIVCRPPPRGKQKSWMKW